MSIDEECIEVLRLNTSSFLTANARATMPNYDTSGQDTWDACIMT